MKIDVTSQREPMECYRIVDAKGTVLNKAEFPVVRRGAIDPFD